MKLFEIDNQNNIIIAPELRIIPSFWNIIKRDRSVNHHIAMKELAFVYYYCDYKSDCILFEDPFKTDECKILANLPNEWRIDKDIKDCIETYMKYQESDAVRLLKAARVGVKKLGEFFETVDLTDINDKGAVIHKPSDIANNIKILGPVISSLKELEEQVKLEISGDSKIRGGGKKGLFEDSNDL